MANAYISSAAEMARQLAEYTPSGKKGEWGKLRVKWRTEVVGGYFLSLASNGKPQEW